MSDLHTGRPGVITLAKNAFLNSLESLGNTALHDFRVIRREGDLFLGAILTTIGIFHFQSDKFCDGNSVDYLSCTRPSSFHFYGGFEILLIVAGVTFILLWALKRRG